MQKLSPERQAVLDRFDQDIANNHVPRMANETDAQYEARKPQVLENRRRRRLEINKASK